MKAFYFAQENKKLRYGDGREISVGATHTVACTPICCEQGLHASQRLIDALKYAPGHTLYLVELSGRIDKQHDKACGERRTYIAEFDAEGLLREFARKQALLHIEKIKPYCSISEYYIILQYLHTGRDSYRSAAESAAWSAAWSAARSAARSAAWSAARSAAWIAAESAAWSAAESAAESAADSAAESAANVMLTDMVRTTTGWDI